MPETAPVKSTVSIYWNENRIPYIEAQSDEDLAIAIGIVHAHLRGSQLQIFRRISQGRLSESAGPLAVDIDKTLRIMNFGRSAAEIAGSMDTNTKRFVSNYIIGLNYYILNVDQKWPELQALNIQPEPFTLEELITVWRLFSADVNWFRMIQAFSVAEEKGGSVEDAWENIKKANVSETEQKAAQILYLSLQTLSRTGSNSLVVSGNRSVNGKPMIASDPHVGLSLPPLWFLMGIRSPSYRAVGLTIPGLPAIALGRNENVAWGGTNMWGISSALVKLNQSDIDTAEKRTETIKVRSWPDTEFTVAETEYGPVLSDSPYMDNIAGLFAFSWMGHEVSDEMSTYLAVMKSRNCTEFKHAFKTWAVSAQNYLCADTEGNILHLLAYRKPVLGAEQPELIRSKDNRWQSFKTPLELPFRLNPVQGFLSSANDRPVFADNEGVGTGYFFSPDARVRRIQEIMDKKQKHSLQDLKKLQQDSCSVIARDGRDFTIELLSKVSFDESHAKVNDFKLSLLNWDGCYETGSRGALYYELFFASLRSSLGLAESSGESYKETLNALSGRNDADTIVSTAAHFAISNFNQNGWILRTPVAHYLGNIPLLGGSWSFEPIIESGASQTLQKRGFKFDGEAANVSYGANARHVSDLSDLDANYFILFGGQDGIMHSPTTIDQIQLWQKGEMIQLPLRKESLVKTQWTERLLMTDLE